MKEFIEIYVAHLENMEKNGEKWTAATLKKHLDMIQFIQHERFVHLIVTFITGIIFLFFVGMAFSQDSIIVSFFGIVITVVLAFYIQYYCYIENRTQCLYKFYYEHVDETREGENHEGKEEKIQSKEFSEIITAQSHKL